MKSRKYRHFEISFDLNCLFEFCPEEGSRMITKVVQYCTFYEQFDWLVNTGHLQAAHWLRNKKRNDQCLRNLGLHKVFLRQTPQLRHDKMT